MYDNFDSNFVHDFCAQVSSKKWPNCYVFDNRTLTTKIATFTVNTYITISNLICKHMYNIFVLLYVNILLEQKYQLHLLVADPQ